MNDYSFTRFDSIAFRQCQGFFASENKKAEKEHSAPMGKAMTRTRWPGSQIFECHFGK